MDWTAGTGLSRCRANASIGGALWSGKGKPGALRDITIEARLHEQHMVTHLNGQGRRAVFTSTRVTLETETGNVLESRANPRRAFEGHTAATPWDDLHVFYFDSYKITHLDAYWDNTALNGVKASAPVGSQR